MTESPALKKLKQAHFCIGQIRVEDQKATGKDLFAIEAHVSSCLQQIKAAFNRLGKELGTLNFKAKDAAWRATLSQEEREFFERMMVHRNDDVHSHDIPLSIAMSAPTAHLDSDGQAISAASVPKYRLQGKDVAAECEKFLTLMEGLVEYAQRL